MQELVGRKWDIVIVLEIWREAKQEKVTPEGGHTWYGSGGCRGKAGVGFIINERVQRRRFTSINERLATLDIDIANEN